MPVNVWHETIDLADIWEAYRADELEFPELRSRTAAAFKASEWAEEYDIATLFEEAANIDEFNATLGFAYDMGDEDRVWINTF